MTTEQFHGDRPIQSEDQDRFGFSELAKRIADALTTQAGNEGFVLGLEGKWGSGKSSLLALTLKCLRGLPPDRVAIVEFRPWLIGDRDQLLVALFADLAKAIASLEQAGGDATSATKLAVDDAVKKVKRFASHLGPVGKLAGAVGLLLPGASLVGTALEKLAEAAADQGTGTELAAQKDELARALLKLNCRIVVAIDDVDRLEPAEVAEVLRLVRSVADFPNVSYFLCYDAGSLGRAIERATDTPDGAAYLEKIVQTEAAVPRLESFALRRWFSIELQKFAHCPDERVRYLQQVVDETGGRILVSPRSVVRVLDSLRFFWPSLRDRVDLVDLVWLRMIAVGSPNLFRWIEEYLVMWEALSGGRVHLSDHDRTAMTKQFDEALRADDLAWDDFKFELERHLPGIQAVGVGDDRDDRIFAKDSEAELLSLASDKRLGSPGHSRLYFSLTISPGSVTDTDLRELLEAANRHANDVGRLLLQMIDEKSDAGLSKAERLLDLVSHIETDVLRSWPAEAIVIGLTNVADELAKEVPPEDFGYPYVWTRARAFIQKLRSAMTDHDFQRLMDSVFSTNGSIGFLSYLLRGETFAHGLYGGRPKPDDALLSAEQFDRVRSSMIRRYGSMGLEKILAHRSATTILYAWSQAGGRDDVVKIVSGYCTDDRHFVDFLGHLFGPSYSLSFEALSGFFEAPSSVVRRIIALAANDPAIPGAEAVLSAIKAHLDFEGLDINTVLEKWDERDRSHDVSVDAD